MEKRPSKTASIGKCSRTSSDQNREKPGQRQELCKKGERGTEGADEQMMDRIGQPDVHVEVERAEERQPARTCCPKFNSRPKILNAL